MSESRNSVTNSLDAESGVSVKSRVSRGRRLLEALFPFLKRRRLERERREAIGRLFYEAQRNAQIAEAMARFEESLKPVRESVSKAAEIVRRFQLVLDMKEEIRRRPKSLSRCAYRRIKEKA